MARPSSKDPLEKFRWAVDIEGFTRLGFSSVEVPSITVNTRSYPEGGAHLFPKKIVDSVSYSPVVLQRGVTSDRSFHEWVKSILDMLHSNSTDVVGYRRTVVIKHLDRAGREVRSYILHNAIPTEYKPASDFSADADDGFSLEKLTLEYESFEVKTLGQENNPFSVKDIAKRLIRRF
jgi:phage tail-like protein